jgi:predicted alternative tryptophan synthase beta-subunit
MAPLVSLLCDQKIIEAVAYHQVPVFEAAVTFAQAEGIVPAPETAHAIKAAIDEARRCSETRQEKVIVFNFSGHGHFDLAAFESYFAGQLQNYEYPQEKVEEALKHVPEMG